MAKLARIFSIPLISTVQTPTNFGDVHPDIKKEQPGTTIRAQKTLFSMLTPEVKAKLVELKRPKIVIYGIEAHICVY